MFGPLLLTKSAPSFTPAESQYSGTSSNGQSCAPTHEQIARSAYQIYEASGRIQGHCKRNWQQAELGLIRNAQLVQSFNSDKFAPHLAGAG